MRPLRARFKKFGSSQTCSKAGHKRTKQVSKTQTHHFGNREEYYAVKYIVTDIQCFFDCFFRVLIRKLATQYDSLLCEDPAGCWGVRMTLSRHICLGDILVCRFPDGMLGYVEDHRNVRQLRRPPYSDQPYRVTWLVYIVLHDCPMSSSWVLTLLSTLLTPSLLQCCDFQSS